jgi:hypothetical protein
VLLLAVTEPDRYPAGRSVVGNAFDQPAHRFDEIGVGARPPLGAQRLQMLANVVPAGLPCPILQLFEHDASIAGAATDCLEQAPAERHT